MTHLLLAISAVVGLSFAFAQERYPDRAIHMLVGFPPGSTADVAARLISQKLSEAMAKPVMVETPRPPAILPWSALPRLLSTAM